MTDSCLQFEMRFYPKSFYIVGYSNLKKSWSDWIYWQPFPKWSSFVVRSCPKESSTSASFICKALIVCWYIPKFPRSAMRLDLNFCPDSVKDQIDDACARRFHFHLSYRSDFQRSREKKMKIKMPQIFMLAQKDLYSFSSLLWDCKTLCNQ